MTRWWAPGGTPVEHLLRRGPDPEKDLGLALLAVHKAGAEACELVAQTALADEMALAAALAETRSLIAKPAVQVISKGVGTPQYAGLLLADLLDDAESAALSLYRSCLAKSVAPPVAAQRVGLVFGVPSRRLGPFSKLATDPKSNPVAVQDAADRALFDYVAHVVTEEYVPLKEAVSKAPEEYHGDDPGERDARGRFARVRSQEEVLPGLSLQDLFNQAAAAPREVATPAQESTAPPEVGTARPQRKMREVRRMARMAKPAPPAEPAAATRELQRTMNRSMSRRRVSAMTRTMTRAEEAVAQAATPVPLSGQARPVPNTTAPRGHLEGAAPLPGSISFVLTKAEYSALTRAAKQGPHGTAVLRLGALEEYAGKARRYEVSKDVLHEDHAEGVNWVLDIELGSDRYEGAEGLETAKLHVANFDPEDIEGSTNHAKDEFVRMVAERRGIPVTPISERGNVSVNVDKDEPSMIVLSWRPPRIHKSGRRDTDRPQTPGVVEIVLPAESVSGIVHRDGSIQVDPNAVVQLQTLAYQSGQGVTGLERTTFWDGDLRAERTKVVGRELPEDDVLKADGDYHGREPGERDAQGQFARVRDRAPVDQPVDLQALFDQAAARTAAPPPRRMAQVRQMRRVARPTPALERTTNRETRRELKRTPRATQRDLAVARQARREFLSRSAGQPNDILWLDEDHEYAVLSPNVVYNMLAADRRQNVFPEAIDRDWTLGEGARAEMMPHGKAVVSALVENQLDTHMLDAWNETLESEQGDMPVEALETNEVIEDPAQLDAIASALANKFKKNPSLTFLTMEMKEVPRSPQGKRQFRLRIYGNREELPIQHVARYSHSAAVDQPRVLKPGHVTRVHNQQTIARWLHLQSIAFSLGETDRAQVHLSNPRVKTWTVE